MDDQPPHDYILPGPLDVSPPGFWDGSVRRAAMDAVLAGVEPGAYGKRVVDWLLNLDDPTIRTFASLMWQCRLAGRAEAALPEGTVTQWGLRLTGESGEPVFEKYPSEDAARWAKPGFQGPFDVAVVSRQVGPWTEAPDRHHACRHCGGEIEPCSTPHDNPVCKGWRHTGYDSQPVIGHCCEGRSINPPAEPAPETAKDDGDA